MNTTTLAADFHTISLSEYRGYTIAKAVSKFSGRQGWVFARGNREYFSKTLKHAKTMIDFGIQHEGY